MSHLSITMNFNLCKIFLIIFIFFTLVSACHQPVEEYTETQPEISAEKAEKFQDNEIIPGMMMEEVQELLGEPTQSDKSPETGNILWVYRNISGVTSQQIHPSHSEFPQGIAYVIPMSYRCQELRIWFSQNKCYQVEKRL